MSANVTKRFTLDPHSPEPGKTDWALIDAMSDEEVERRANADPDALPRTDAELARARRVRPVSTVLRATYADLEELAGFVVSVFQDVQRLEKMSAHLSEAEKSLKSWSNLFENIRDVSNFNDEMRLLAKLAQSVRTSVPHIEVRPVPTGWIIWRTGTDVPTSRHRTKHEALTSARRIARKKSCDLFVYASDGELQRRICC